MIGEFEDVLLLEVDLLVDLFAFEVFADDELLHLVAEQLHL